MALLGDLEALLAEIRRRAEQRVLALESRVQREAEALRQAGAEQAEAEAAQLAEQARREAAALTRKLRMQGVLAAQRHLLQAREALLVEVWAEAEAALRALVASPDYPAVLRRLAAGAVAALGTRAIVLAADDYGHALLTPERLAAWGTELEVRFEAAPEAAPIWGGLWAWSGRLRYDASFETRLALAKARLRDPLLVELGGSP